MVKLGKTKFVGIGNDKCVGIGDVDTVFDDGCANKHVPIALCKRHNGILECHFAHLAVRHNDFGIGEHFLEFVGKAVDGLHAVVHAVHLSATGKFARDNVGKQGVTFLHDKGFHRHTLNRWGCNCGDISYAGKGHVQCTRNGCCAHCKYVNGRFESFDFFLVFYAKTLFLVQHKQAKFVELHVLGQKSVGANDDVHPTLAQVFENVALFFRRPKTV